MELREKKRQGGAYKKAQPHGKEMQEMFQTKRRARQSHESKRTGARNEALIMSEDIRDKAPGGGLTYLWKSFSKVRV